MVTRGKMDNDGPDAGNDGLEALFATARGDGPRPDLAARVLADAVQVQAAQALSERRSAVPAPRVRGWLSGRLTGIVAGLGGWSAVSGITAAGIVGLGVGLYSPDVVTGWIGGDGLPFTAAGYDILPDIGALWTENGDV